ncbi:MAG: nuclear transport factor 2 family protein [Gammaproteobacteria bacterium]|nr:nuclear transport factor 2 family protein [Gammaproteobacteria bacterium]
MNRTLLIAAALIANFQAIADAASDREAVIGIIDAFFESMTDRDVERMRTLMTPDGVLYGYRETDEGLQIIRPTHGEYLENLANGEGRPVERYWDPEIMVSGRLATIWTPYDFHVDGQFSHCGINNFSMLKTDAGWVITGVVFSIQSDNCPDSPLGPPVN